MIYNEIMVGINLIVYISAFIVLWRGAGLIIASVDGFSRRLKLSSFAISFFVLGMLTSIPEFAVGLTAVAERKPEIYVGNLIGGIIVLFLFVIPVLAIFGNGIRLCHDLSDKNLIFSFITVIAPAFITVDNTLTIAEGIILIILYAALFYLIESKKGMLDNRNSNLMNVHSYSFNDVLKILLGVALVFLSSNLIVEKTLYFADVFKLPAFFISLIVLSLGTNLPELSLAFSSILSGKKDIAFGDYLGSAAANSFLLGLFIILGGGNVTISNNPLRLLIITGLGFILFYYFSRSRHDISKKEGLVLLCLYAIFIILEMV